MANFYIHIGVPRTGTTVLQKYVLPRSVNSLLLSKRPYGTSGTAQEVNSKRNIDNYNLNELIKTQIGRERLLTKVIMLGSIKLAVDENRNKFSKELERYLTELKREETNHIIISSEE